MSSRRIGIATFATVVLLAISPSATHSQEVELAVVDVAQVAKGYRASELLGRSVINDRKERIGELSDFILGADGPKVFAVLQVGGFLDRDSHFVAVPIESLKLVDGGRQTVLPGASRDALTKLPVFNFGN